MTKQLLALAIVPLLGFAACDSSSGSDESKKETRKTEASDTKAAAEAGSKAEAKGFGLPFAPIEIEVSDKAKATAKAMLGRVSDDRLDDADYDGDPEALTWIAATSTNPKVAGDALYGLSTTKQAPPPTAAKVIAARLHCGDNDILEAFDGALRDITVQPVLSNDKTVIDAIVDAARNHPNELIKERALVALWSLPPGRPERATVVDALDPASPPARLMEILDEIAFETDDPLYAKGLDKVLALTSHPEAMVRGAAAKCAGASHDDGDRVQKRLVELLSDDSAFVRCRALKGFGYMRKSLDAVLPQVQGQLDDSASCELDVDLPTVRGTEQVELSKSTTVAIEAAFAIQSMSLNKSDRFEVPRKPDGAMADHPTVLTAAKDWAKKHA